MTNRPKSTRVVDRGASEVIGVSLLLGIVIIAIITLIGGILTAGTTSTDRIDAQAATAEISDIHTKMSQILFSDSDRVTDQIETQGDGTITLNRGGSTPTYRFKVNSQLLARDALGTSTDPALNRIEFIDGNDAVIYENGLLFREYRDGTIEIVNTPPTSINTGQDGRRSLNIHIIKITDSGESGSLRGDITVEHLDAISAYEQRWVPSGGSQYIEIESEYPEAWETHFENVYGNWSAATVSRTGDMVRVDFSGHSGFYLNVVVHVVDVRG